MQAITVCGHGKLQQFHSLDNFFTQSLRSDLELDAPLRPKLQKLVAHLLKLGVRHPSETSWKHIVCVLTVTAGEEMTPGQRHGVYIDMKMVFKQIVRTYPAPREAILDYPTTPNELNTQFPATYSDVFGLEPPTPSTLNPGDLRLAIANTPLRRSKTSLLQISTGAPSNLGDMATNAFTMMRGMQDMQARQMEMMMAMSNRTV